MTRLRRVASIWLAVTSAIAASALAQDLASLLGQPVVAVRFEIEGRPETSPALAALSDVRPGSPLREDAWRSTIARIDALGRFENIVAVAQPVPGGVDVIFRLIPRHPINRLDVRGVTGIPPDALRQQVMQRYGGVPATTRPAAVAAAAAQFVRDAGYLDAQVTAETELTHDPDSATLVLQVQAGPIAPVSTSDVEIRGVQAMSRDDIIERTGTTIGSPFRRRDIESSLIEIEDDLRRRGFYEVQAVLQSARVENGVRVHIIVDTGPRVQLVVRPAGVIPRTAIDDLIPIERLGSADQDLLEDSRARIEARLKREGFYRASAPFTRDLHAAEQRLDIIFDIVRGPRFFVERVELPAALSLPAATVRRLIDLGPGDVFDERRFLAGLSLVADAYRREGHYNVEVTPAYEEVPSKAGPSETWVVLHPNIAEGPRGVLARIDVTFAGPHQVSEAELRAVMRSRVGAPYIQAESAADEQTLRELYVNRGFRTAAVSVRPTFAAEGREAALTVAVNEGVQALIGDIQVSGNSRTSTNEILDTLQIQPGDPAGKAALDAALRRLNELGVFRRVSLRVDELVGEARVLLVVSVSEAPNSILGWGVGLEGRRNVRESAAGGFEDYLEFSPRGSFEIGRRNLGGRDRSLNLFSRVSFNPTRRRAGDTGGTASDSEEESITEYRVTGTYRERRAWRTNLDLLVGVVSEQAFRTNFDFVRNSANAELLRRVSPTVNWIGRYSLDFTRLINERIAEDDPDRPVIDRLFPQVRLSILATGVSWDRRNDPLSPTTGTLVTADGEVASRSLGSEVGYLKTFFQVSAFRPLDAAARTVLAGRAQIGAARGFRRTVQELDDEGRPVFDDNGNPILTVVQDLPASQRFFAGGGTTVRGFQPDRLGVPELLNGDGLSLGGNGLVVLNAELRRLACRCKTFMGSTLSVVGFLDGGNVFVRAADIDLGRLRGAAGAGIRYNSPLGPLRFDLGFKMSRRDAVGGRPERGWEYHLSIGETF